ncbi:potassium transporter TrkG [Ilumatobacter sp.]|uniref:potassium transporter TrkG n=1 Tax=Ilumatobacter sp. TaxID=1967498 RepID=UPI003B51C659
MIRTVLLAMAVPAAAALTVVPIAGATGRGVVSAVFFGAAVVLGAIAYLAHRWSSSDGERPEPVRLGLVAATWIAVALVTSAVTWTAILMSPASAGAPALRDPLSALFESISGLSTTGLTVVDDSGVIEEWLQWWRTVLQWVGAFGVVLFAVTVAEPSGDHDTLIGSDWGEAPGGDALETARRLVGILAVITALSVVAMIVVGEPVWRAVNHGMTAAATGGFSVATNSAGDSGPAVRVILAATLVVSAMAFGTLWDRARRVGLPLWRRTQVRYGFGATVICVAVALLVRDGSPAGDVVFNSISASTTGGFSVGSSYSSVQALSGVAMVSMFIGGAAGSTAGGIKAARLAWLTKAAARWLPGRSDLDDDVTYRWDGGDVGRDDARHRIMGAAAIVVTWLMIVSIGTVVMAAHNPNLAISDVLFEAFSAGSGVGLSSGLTAETLDATTKLTLSTLMLAGRVEMTAFVVLLVGPFVKAADSATSSSIDPTP